MNVLFIDQFSEFGGAQQCLLDLIPAVKTRGWKAYAAVPTGELALRLAAAGVTVHGIEPGSYTSGRKGVIDVLRYLWTMPRVSRQLRACIREHQIDLLYVNGPRLLPAAALAADLPLLFHAHNYLPPGLSRQVALSTLRMRRSEVIAVSAFVGGYLLGAIPIERISVVRNGVADARRASQRRGTLRIGIIGRIAPEKGQLDFVEAARLLPRDWRFTICGAALLALPGYEAAVRQQAAELPIEFPGWQNDVAAVLSTLDLLIVPSASHEALGRVILEAFSAEVPVVAYPSGGIPELIEDGKTGFLVPARTPHALAARIREVIADEALRCRVARNARIAWESHYTLERYREGVTQIMARAASRHSKPAPISTGG